ncbi:uncharacterized protein AMSG_02663 [Thecamonas trahens ATCC 50062]|uniref:Pre-rRNA-processing protein RIX1 N-terminal domain-containing protein n=1 Tax=Thecamonas trahens ATCC 50062 TaxID=461836 RepID=A0A0L0D1S2_THETB|nr:hypothetical protein AMSG_02663 [Thecamonas trahens ATCC 50062]KNC46212.1 hypothetical protein AMSG_02663 [Thecamonas trahens ATCC 50062]|eukprot:XP_013760509.1 hypothetical protein AMSG_02663 [Thecamonas trahens ATCC 50062]
MASQAPRRMLNMVSSYLASPLEAVEAVEVVIETLTTWELLNPGSEELTSGHEKVLKATTAMVTSTLPKVFAAGIDVLNTILAEIVALTPARALYWRPLLAPRYPAWLQALAAVAQRVVAKPNVRAAALGAIGLMLRVLATIPELKKDVLSGHAAKKAKLGDLDARSSSSFHLSGLMTALLSPKMQEASLMSAVAHAVAAAVDVLGVSLRPFVAGLETLALPLLDAPDAQLAETGVHILAALPRIVKSDAAWSGSYCRVLAWAHAVLDIVVGKPRGAGPSGPPSYHVPGGGSEETPAPRVPDGTGMMSAEVESGGGRGHARQRAKSQADASSGFRTRVLAKLDPLTQLDALRARFSSLCALLTALLKSSAAGAGKGTVASLLVVLPIDASIGLIARVLAVDVGKLSRSSSTGSVDVSALATAMFSSSLMSAQAALLLPHMQLAVVAFLGTLVELPGMGAMSARYSALTDAMRTAVMAKRGPGSHSASPGYHAAVYHVFAAFCLRLPFVAPASTHGAMSLLDAAVTALTADLALIPAAITSGTASTLSGGRRRKRGGAAGATSSTNPAHALSHVTIHTVAAEALAVAAADALEALALGYRGVLPSATHDALEAACIGPLLEPAAKISNVMRTGYVKALTACLMRPRVVASPSLAFAVQAFTLASASTTSTEVLRAATAGRALAISLMHPRVPLLTSRPIVAAAHGEIQAQLDHAVHTEAAAAAAAGAAAANTAPLASLAVGSRKRKLEPVELAPEAESHQPEPPAKRAKPVWDAPAPVASATPAAPSAPIPALNLKPMAVVSSGRDEAAPAVDAVPKAAITTGVVVPDSLVNNVAASMAPAMSDSDSDSDFGLVDAPPSDDEA